MTLPEAVNHSLAQLKLMIQAAGRVKAGNGLLTCRVSFSSFAAVMSKDGGRLLEKTQKALIKQASNG